MKVIASSDDGPYSAGWRSLSQIMNVPGIDYLLRPSESANCNTGTALEDRNRNKTCAGVVREALELYPAHVVLIGINHGPNIGSQAVHSGTIGGVITAMSCDVAGIAISLDDVYSTRGTEDSHLQWQTAQQVSHGILDWCCRNRDVLYGLSVNIPNVAVHEIRGVTILCSTTSDSDERTILEAYNISIRPVQPIFAGRRLPRVSAAKDLGVWLKQVLAHGQSR